MRAPARYTTGFFSDTEHGGLTGAGIVVREVQSLMAVHSVADLGCGTGGWLAAFADAGVPDVLGVDGDWVPRRMLRIAAERFVAHDLTRPFRYGRTFDLAMSIETAEHLPPDAAEDFVASLTSLAPAVLFSAAVPGQGGVGHVNEQWPEYWCALFARRGYSVIDALRPRIWKVDVLAPCVRQNLLLFASAELLASNLCLAHERAGTDERQLSLVHPELFRDATDPRRMSLRRTLRTIPRIAAGAVERGRSHRGCEGGKGEPRPPEARALPAARSPLSSGPPVAGRRPG